MTLPSLPRRFAIISLFRPRASLLALAFLAAAALARADRAATSELLERGIYAEETKGDLDAAMKLYQQVITDANASQSLAAQAQLRLAICYDKKKDFAAATAAFEKLVHDFPNQKEYVAQANEYLGNGAVFLPAPWTDGEELQLQIKLQTGVRFGIATYTVDAGEIDGKKIWRFGSHLFLGAPIVSRTEVDARTLRPIHSWLRQPLIGQADVTYTANRADLKFSNHPELKHVDISGPIYDNSEILQLSRRLPLAVGYKANFQVLVSVANGAVVNAEVAVVGKESVTVPAGTFACYKLSVGSAVTYWVSADEHRWLVKTEEPGATTELTQIIHHTGEKSVNYKDPVFHFSFSAPAGWFFYRQENPEDTKRSTVMALDPQGATYFAVKVENKTNFSAEAQTSPRGFANHQLSEWPKYVKEVNVRKDSWTDMKVAGQPAVRIIADQVVKAGLPQTVTAVYAIVGNQAVDISMGCSPDEFDSFRSAFTTVVETYRPN